MRSLTPLRSLVLLVSLTFIVLFALAPRYDLLEERASEHAHVARAAPLFPRQSNSVADGGDTASASSPSPTSASPSATSASPTSAEPSSTSTTSSSADTTTAQSTPSPTSATPSVTPSSATPTDPASASLTAAPSVSSSQPQQASVITSGSVIVTFTLSASDSSTASASASANADSSNKSSSSGISTSTIVGLSVAGGVAVLGIVAFFVWKCTRKRFEDLDDSAFPFSFLNASPDRCVDEAIKWPELNNHSDMPLPTHRTGGAGFGDDPDDMSRAPSRAGTSAYAASTTELYPDPYAIPPLPHLNPAGGPGGPYRDEPDAQHFYDPYRGPVPQTFDGVPGAGEVIPMTQLPAAGRSRSPGPGVPFDSPQAGYAPYAGEGGRASPAPNAYGGRASPAPNAYGGRASPGPQTGYGGYAAH